MEKLLNLLNEINPDIDYLSEKHLLDDGLFDSLEILSIITAIDDHYGIEINAEDVSAENFNSIDSIMNLIKKYRGE